MPENTFKIIPERGRFTVQDDTYENKWPDERLDTREEAESYIEWAHAFKCGHTMSDFETWDERRKAQIRKEEAVLFAPAEEVYSSRDIAVSRVVAAVKVSLAHAKAGGVAYDAAKARALEGLPKDAAVPVVIARFTWCGAMLQYIENELSAVLDVAAKAELPGTKD